MSEPETSEADRALAEVRAFVDAITQDQVALERNGAQVPMTKVGLIRVLEMAHEGMELWSALADYARDLSDQEGGADPEIIEALYSLLGLEPPESEPEHDAKVLQATMDQLAALGVPPKDLYDQAVAFLGRIAEAQEGGEQVTQTLTQGGETRRPSPLPAGAEETEQQRAQRFQQALLSGNLRPVVPPPPITAEDLANTDMANVIPAARVGGRIQQPGLEM